MLTSRSHRLIFDEFTFDTFRGVLLRGDIELPLRRQSFEVLRYLAEHAGKAVSSDELIDALWLTRPADHTASVGQCIKEIRRAIGDDARWIIKTVSGRGYEFMAEVAPSAPLLRPDAVSSTSAAPAAMPEQLADCEVKESRRLRPHPRVHFGERSACLPSFCPACSSPVPGRSGRGGTQRPVKA